MTAHVPPPTKPCRSEFARQLVVFGALLVVLGGAAGVWFWHRAQRLTPPMPADIQDAEVRNAIEKARQQVFSDPDSAEAWGQLGRMLLAHLFDRDADACFAQAARLNPDDPMWSYSRGVIALKREPDKAIPLLRQAAAGISRPEYRSLANLQLAEAYLERENLDEAEKLFRSELDSEPDNARAALGLGLVAKVRGNEKAATTYLTIAQGSPHARKVATAQLAALARSRGDHAAAAAYDQATADLPNDTAWPDPLLDGNMLLVVGRRGWERQVDQLERQGDYAKAVEKYLKKIEDEPTMQNYVGAGINLARLRDYDQALPLLRKAVAIAPESAHAHYSLGAVLCGRAEREWESTPGSSQVKNWFQEAIDESRRAAELRPDHARAYLHWGVSLKYLGDPAGAIAPLKKGVACHPADFDLQLVLGEVLVETGNAKEAANHLENARRLNPNDPRPGQFLERLKNKTQ
jgi:tetratricopeptide (TPR) repeat protein